MSSPMNHLAGLAWAPLVDPTLLLVLGSLGLVLLAWGLFRRARGTMLRLLPLAALVIVLANPQMIREERVALDDIALVVVDRSPSQALADRPEATDRALTALQARLQAEKGLEVRVIEAGTDAQGDGTAGTRLMTALERAAADIPRSRLAGAVLLTDGQVHDVAEDGRVAFPAPVHTLLTGHRTDSDRRLVVESAPTYGLVDNSATIRLRVEDALGQTVPLTITVDDAPPRQIMATPGQTLEVPVTVTHGGPNIIDLGIPTRDGELTTANNRTALAINGVRDRLRVLLISGEPHVGERAWRSLLKGDPNVDLVHFTILRPPTKDDGTPLGELALIAFPTRELFEEKLAQFDLVIFDRYSRRGLVPFGFLRNVADYVRQGGAVLQAVGPEFAGPFTLFDSPLAEVMPATPAGAPVSVPFRPTLTDIGQRHPVTAGLPGAGGAGQPATWGRWMRQLSAARHSGETLMTGYEGQPLLILDRVEKGRVALLLSDTIWLWARGFDGGGPQAELVRRLAHWLMAEPELEEEALTASSDGRTLSIDRRSLKQMAPNGTKVTLTAPDGTTSTANLVASQPGREHLTLPVSQPGVWRVSAGPQTAVAAVGSADPLELRDVATTDRLLRPVAVTTGGGVYWLDDGLPRLRRTSATAAAAGSGWFGLVANEDHLVTGVRQDSLLPPIAAVLLVLGGLMLAWWREGR